jgi:hypothetical protein
MTTNNDDVNARIAALEFRLATLEALVSNYLSSIYFDADDDRPWGNAARIAAMVARRSVPIDVDVGANASKARKAYETDNE